MLVCNVSELLLCCVLGTLLNYGEFLDFLVNLAVVLLILWRLGFSVVLEVHDQSLWSLTSGINGFELESPQARIAVNVGQNASLVWTYKLDALDKDYTVLWGTSEGKDYISNILFTKNQHQLRPKPRANMPPSYVGRVRIINKATLHISSVTLADSGHYMCEMRDDFISMKKEVILDVIGGCLIQYAYLWNDFSLHRGQHILITNLKGKFWCLPSTLINYFLQSTCYSWN